MGLLRVLRSAAADPRLGIVGAVAALGWWAGRPDPPAAAELVCPACGRSAAPSAAFQMLERQGEIETVAPPYRHDPCMIPLVARAR